MKHLCDGSNSRDVSICKWECAHCCPVGWYRFTRVLHPPDSMHRHCNTKALPQGINWQTRHLEESRATQRRLTVLTKGYLQKHLIAHWKVNLKKYFESSDMRDNLIKYFCGCSSVLCLRQKIDTMSWLEPWLFSRVTAQRWDIRVLWATTDTKPFFTFSLKTHIVESYNMYCLLVI